VTGKLNYNKLKYSCKQPLPGPSARSGNICQNG